ncbi:MAG: prephenate dehydratase [Bacteroidales bacterium]|nr:prephenate dehydratase [Bacteroidales bacterium]MDT8373762.1 prephenate dehydratase [Bacteroidales bacterium]
MDRQIYVAIQGEKGSFHEVAANDFFGDERIILVPCPTFDETVNAVLRGRAEYAVMAIENARAGSILYNYNLIRESRLKILGEIRLRIRQNLMALPGTTIDSLSEIRSHPIALAQCMEFLNTLKGVTLIETDDTAGSARIISEQELAGTATIASASAADIYGLEMLAGGIETYKKNYTKFHIIGNESLMLTVGDKASVCFATGHKPGSLARVLLILAGMDINLSKIQSVPRLNGNWEYMFYVDLELSTVSKMDHIVNALEEHTMNLEILGIYNKDNNLYES